VAVVVQPPWIGANRNSAPISGPMSAEMNAARWAIGPRDTLRNVTLESAHCQLPERSLAQAADDINLD
jgi:hypothetical protein